MFNIANFFEKFSKIQSTNSELKESVSNIIKNITGIYIDPKKIEINNKDLKLNINPVIKNEIFFHKEKIFQKINILNSEIKNIR